MGRVGFGVDAKEKTLGEVGCLTTILDTAETSRSSSKETSGSVSAVRPCGLVGSHSSATSSPSPRPEFKSFWADLYFESRKLCVEIDGPAHDVVEDDERDFWLREHGYKVVRFTNKRAMQDTLEVVREIQEALA